jgi:glycosyltransferase involved in cell wall biosynthesis
MSTWPSQAAAGSAVPGSVSPVSGASLPPEVSVVLPCLNEEETVGVCVEKALRSLHEAGISGEVIVADNGSSDHSREIAAAAGARVVAVAEKGYGNALMGGIAASSGRYVVMADADDSYDLLDVPRFVEALREGRDFVQGCRLPAGGGMVEKGAMPFLHRWLGNPALSFAARRMFRVPVHDVYCGMRGFTRALYDRLSLRSPGMEFATEMVIRAKIESAATAEIPIVLHRDGRKSSAPHLRTFRDGWRTLRFFLIYSPRWLFLYPAAFLALFGVAGYALALPAAQIGRATLGAHTLLVASLAILLAQQSAFFAIAAKAFGIREGLLQADRRTARILSAVTLERGLVAGALAVAFGSAFLLLSVGRWWQHDFGPLDYGTTLRWLVPGVTLIALGVQAMMWSFFVSLLRMKRT